MTATKATARAAWSRSSTRFCRGEREKREGTTHFLLSLLLFHSPFASSMRVRLLLFARAKELVGTGETELELAEGALSLIGRIEEESEKR